MESCGKNCKQLIGMLCVIIAQVKLGSLRFMTHKSKYLQFFSGMRSVLIEKYVKKFNLHPLKMVAYDGINICFFT